MEKINKELVKSTFIYVLGSSLNKLSWLLLAPVITSNISPADYGAYGIVLVFCGFCGANLWSWIRGVSSSVISTEDNEH